MSILPDAHLRPDMFNGYNWQTRTLEVRPDRLPPDFDNPTPMSNPNALPSTSAAGHALSLHPYGTALGEPTASVPDDLEVSKIFGERPRTGTSPGSRSLFVGNVSLRAFTFSTNHYFAAAFSLPMARSQRSFPPGGHDHTCRRGARPGRSLSRFRHRLFRQRRRCRASVEHFQWVSFYYPSSASTLYPLSQDMNTTAGPSKFITTSIPRASRPSPPYPTHLFPPRVLPRTTHIHTRRRIYPCRPHSRHLSTLLLAISRRLRSITRLVKYHRTTYSPPISQRSLGTQRHRRI